MDKKPHTDPHPNPLPAIPMSPDERYDSMFTALPEDFAADVDLEYGEMNEADARASGYVDQDGNAVSLARKDIKGNPTGAFTDIGEGRSGVVKRK